MLNREEVKQKLKKDTEDWQQYKTEVLSKIDPLDEDGYPTEVVLEAISNWHWTDTRAMFDYIHDLWAYADDGYWKEKEVMVDDHGNIKYEKPRLRYYISTAGWSGNESIIKAMKENAMFWTLNWVQSRRGGHYIFELKEFDK
jgi:hypothetical protein